jgi:hypothetical protein
MTSLTFTITPTASSILHGVLVCLSRFSDTVIFEAKEDNVCEGVSGTADSKLHVDLVLAAHSQRFK